MAIVYPLDVPLEQFSTVDVESVDINQIQTSTFTGKDRLQEFEGDYWKIKLRYENLDRDLGRPVSAFIKALRKSVGTFVVSFPGYVAPRGEARNFPISPLVNGGGQAGTRSLNIKNATPSTANWLLAGDIIQVGPDTRPHWHEVLADVDTAADGTASIDVWPSIRNTTINNDNVVLDNPRCLFRMERSAVISIRPPVISETRLECREAVP